MNLTKTWYDVGDFNYHDYLKEVTTAAKGCAISPHDSKGLVLDDYTYMYFKESKYPLLITYLALHTDAGNVRKLINDGKIKAVIVRCGSLSVLQNMPVDEVLHYGNVCCYTAHTIDKIKNR